MKFYRQTFRQIPVHSTPLLGCLPLASRLLVLYCAKHCARDGSIPIRDAEHVGASLRHRFGGNPRETPMIDAAVRIARECGAMVVTDKRIVIVEFPLWQRRTFDTWRRLYVREEVAFGKLPLFARALAVEVLRICNDDGVIALDAAGLVSWLASRGATKADRKADRKAADGWVAALIAEGYLIAAGGHLAVKNFRVAQGFETQPVVEGGAKGNEPGIEGASKGETSVVEGGAKGNEPGIEGASKGETSVVEGGAKGNEPGIEGGVETAVTSRKDSDHVPAFIHSSIHSSSVLGTPVGDTVAPSSDPLPRPTVSTQEPEPFRLTAPPPAPPRRSKRAARVDTLPLAPCVPERNTGARVIFDAIQSERAFGTMHQPGENCLRWVTMFGASLGIERMRLTVHSAAQFLESPKCRRSYPDLAKFLLNQFKMVLECEGPTAEPAVRGTPGTLSVFDDAASIPSGVVAVG